MGSEKKNIKYSGKHDTERPAPSVDDVPEKTRAARESIRGYVLIAVVTVMCLIFALFGVGTAGIIIATILLIAVLVALQLVNSREYNRSNQGVKIVNHAGKHSIEELFAMVKDVTLEGYGTPELRRVKSIPGRECVVYGPADGGFIYFYKNRLGNRIYIAFTTLISLLEGSEQSLSHEIEGYFSYFCKVESEEDALMWLQNVLESYIVTGKPAFDDSYDSDYDPRDYGGILYSIVSVIDWFQDRGLEGLIYLIFGWISVIAFIILVFVVGQDKVNVDPTGMVSAFMLFIDVPLTLYLFVKGIYLLIKDRRKS